ARNSLGAYVESVPTTILPSDFTASGTLAASAASRVDVELGDGVCCTAPSSFLLHAAPARASARTRPVLVSRVVRTEPPRDRLVLSAVSCRIGSVRAGGVREGVLLGRPAVGTC